MNHEAPQGRTLSGDEVSKHNSQESCWVIVNDAAYDVTGEQSKTCQCGYSRLIDCRVHAGASRWDEVSTPVDIDESPFADRRQGSSSSMLERMRQKHMRQYTHLIPWSV